MTEFTLDELSNAEIVPGQGGANAWLCRFGPEDYRMVNKTTKHRLLLETDVLSEAAGGDTRRIDDPTGPNGQVHVTFTADVDNDRYHLTVDGRRVSVPADHEDKALEAYADDDWDHLVEIHADIVANRVRVGLMDNFMPRFADAKSEGRLRKTEDGWVLDETFVVKWDGENYLRDNVQQFAVNGTKTVTVDETKQARVLTFPNLSDEMDVETPGGREVTISRREGKFLATVECLLNPNEYLTDEQAEFVEDAVESVQDPIAAAARSAQVEGFTDEKSGLYHGHGIRKHTLDMLGVTDEVSERLFYNDWDHAGVHELKARRDEFISAPFDVFENTSDDNPAKWEKIEATSRKAPIPQDVRSDINDRFQ